VRDGPAGGRRQHVGAGVDAIRLARHQLVGARLLHELGHPAVGVGAHQAERAGVVHGGEGDGGLGAEAAVVVGQRGEVEVGEDVPVQHEHVRVVEEVLGVGDRAGGAERLRIDDVPHLESPRGAVAEVLLDLARAVAAREHDAPHAGALQVVHLPLHEGQPHERQHRLGQRVGEGAHARAVEESGEIAFIPGF